MLTREYIRYHLSLGNEVPEYPLEPSEGDSAKQLNLRSLRDEGQSPITRERYLDFRRVLAATTHEVIDVEKFETLEDILSCLILEYKWPLSLAVELFDLEKGTRYQRQSDVPSFFYNSLAQELQSQSTLLYFRVTTDHLNQYQALLKELLGSLHNTKLRSLVLDTRSVVKSRMYFMERTPNPRIEVKAYFEMQIDLMISKALTRIEELDTKYHFDEKASEVESDKVTIYYQKAMDIVAKFPKKSLANKLALDDTLERLETHLVITVDQDDRLDISFEESEIEGILSEWSA